MEIKNRWPLDSPYTRFDYSSYQPQPVAKEDLSLMQLIDRMHMKKPFLGSRRIVDALAEQGYETGRKHVRRLMRLMGIQAIHPGPKTSKPHLQHKIRVM